MEKEREKEALKIEDRAFSNLDELIGSIEETIKKGSERYIQRGRLRRRIIQKTSAS